MILPVFINGVKFPYGESCEIDFGLKHQEIKTHVIQASPMIRIDGLILDNYDLISIILQKMNQAGRD
ncbi:hypothetical protein [Gimesia aquarii]|uniref:Uncharacterized protein n=1 Tax=Gimesia aquarii TaxID=2527964 RepID=A0A517X193_9PLAN|nr:hypothetical protein [Gimesia aquarii]QDU11271.1 hypothetical protein V202x_46900 [Gimesia aquarii]